MEINGKKIRRLALWVFLFGVGTLSLEASVATPDIEKFEAANRHYEKGDYRAAASIYRELSVDYPQSPVFYFNLGNSLYRLGERGPALLAYERARMISPRNPDIAHNLKHVRDRLEYYVEDKRNWYLRAADSFLERFTEREAALVLLAVYFVFAASWAWMLFLKPRETWGWRRKVIGGILVLAAAFFLAKHFQSSVIRDAVVMKKEAEVRYGPAAHDRVAFRLGEGLKVDVIDSRQDWSRILLVNGETGWIKNEDIEKVRRE